VGGKKQTAYEIFVLIDFDVSPTGYVSVLIKG